MYFQTWQCFPVEGEEILEWTFQHLHHQRPWIAASLVDVKAARIEAVEVAPTWQTQQK